MAFSGVLLQKFDVLDPTLDIGKSYFLEASAGTGKTFAIEHLFVRLVKECKLPIQEILAVTFTREAAHEMKMRIKEKLGTYEELQVFTIHGFCHKILSEFAFEAKAPLQLSSPDRPDHLEEMREVALDFLRVGPKKFADEVAGLLKKMRYDLDRLINYLIQEMQNGEGELAKECLRKWKIKALSGDHLTFDDLLKNTQKALEIPLFLESVQAKYKAVIVDEFQDTDPTQWNIFETLFLKSHLLYLVGDPKQSIYRFRSADIYTYMRAAEALGTRSSAFLDTNFRSSPKLIDALNALFTKHPDWIALPSMPEALAYHPVKAGREENLLDEAPIQGFLVDGIQGRERSWPTKKMEEEKIFPYIASEILRLHREYDIAFSEMAVLVKDRFQGQRLQTYFHLWSIPTLVRRTRNLCESRGFIAMEMLLNATAHPQKEKTVRAALLGLSIKDNPFFELKELFLEKGFAQFFTHFISEYFQGDRSLYLELRQTAEILMESRGSSLGELLYLMSVLKAKNPEEDERLALRNEEGENKVPIMTTFASKGLEFEVVFALGMASRHFGEEQDAEDHAEKMRQLYVAFTRAKEKLYIPILNPRNYGSPIEIFFSKWDKLDIPLEKVGFIPITPYSIESEEEEIWQKPPRLKAYFPIEPLTSFTALAKPKAHTFLAEKFQLQDLSKKTLHTLPLGAETGIVIHSLFETHFDDRALPIEQIVCEVLTGTHLEGWEEAISDMMHHVLHMPLFEDFSLSQLKEKDYFQEMEFLFPKDNQVIKGFADLVFQRGDTFYLLDWKTNWLGPSDEDYSEENLQKAMEEHDYFLQADLYREAVQRYVKLLYKNPKFGGAYYMFLRGKKGIHFGTGKR